MSRLQSSIRFALPEFNTPPNFDRDDVLGLSASPGSASVPLRMMKHNPSSKDPGRVYMETYILERIGILTSRSLNQR